MPVHRTPAETEVQPMQAGSSSAQGDSIRRRSLSLTLLGLVLLVVSAIAGSGGLAMAGKPSAGTPTITLGSINGTGMAAAKVQPALGDRVTFATTNISSYKNPRVALTCSNNGTLLFGEGGSPTDTFKLGGDSSQWLSVGGPAYCSTELFIILNANGTGEWNGHGAQGGIVDLADYGFNASGN
jgi:hypothetical protein